MVPGEVAQIKIGDYVIPKKDKCVLVCTNVRYNIENDRSNNLKYTHVFCFDVAFEEVVDYYGSYIVIFDMKEILDLEATLIKKNTKAANILEMLYGKV